MYVDDQCQTMPLFKIRDFQKHGPRQSSRTASTVKTDMDFYLLT